MEDDHVDFANTAIHFFSALANQRNFSFDTLSNWKELTDSALKNCQLVIWLDDFPQSAVQRSGFENYMEYGGTWLGFHVSAYMIWIQSGHGLYNLLVVPFFLITIGTPYLQK